MNFCQTNIAHNLVCHGVACNAAFLSCIRKIGLFPVATFFDPSDQFASVSSPGPDQLQTWIKRFRFLHNHFSAITILNRCHINPHNQQKPHCINPNMPLTPFDLLSGPNLHPLDNAGIPAYNVLSKYDQNRRLLNN